MYVQAGLALHSPQNKVVVANGRQGLVSDQPVRSYLRSPCRNIELFSAVQTGQVSGSTESAYCHKRTNLLYRVSHN